MKIKKPEPALAKPRLSPYLSELMNHLNAKNSWAKKLISEDSDFAEPKNLQDFGPIISNAKDLADYLLEMGFILSSFTKDHSNRLDICVKYSTAIKIEQKHTEYPDLKGYEIGIYKEDLDVFIKELTNNKTKITVTISIHLPYSSRNYPITFYCFSKKIHNAQLQNFARTMEKVLTYFEDAQKYIDSGKEPFFMVLDIKSIF